MISRPLSPSSTAIAVLETDEQSAHRIADLVAESLPADEIAVALVDIGAGRWRVAMHFRVAPDEKLIRTLTAAAAGKAAAKALRFERVAATDWVRESLAGLAPVTAGRFIVHGTHDRARIPFNRIGIEIEAALAFGTGHHGTTRGCLLALDRICKTMSRRYPIHRHPEVRAKGTPRRMSARAVALRGSLRSHLRVTA
jgi:ribosomal protein L11 methyltransferase